MSLSARFPPRDSKGKIDLHVFMISLSEWQHEFCTADEEALSLATSLGFIQVSPSWNLYATRDFINDQLKRENPHVPDEFTFLRVVGRIAAVNRAQEHKLKASEFAPEIFIIPMRYEDLLPGSKKSDRSSPRNLRYIPPSAKYTPSTATRSRPNSHGRYNGFPPTIEIDQGSPILADPNPYLTDNELSDQDQEVATLRKGRRSGQKSVTLEKSDDIDEIQEDIESFEDNSKATEELLEEIRSDIHSLKSDSATLDATVENDASIDSRLDINENVIEDPSLSETIVHTMDIDSSQTELNNTNPIHKDIPKISDQIEADVPETSLIDPQDTINSITSDVEVNIDFAAIPSKGMTRKRRAEVIAMVLGEFMAEAGRRKPVSAVELEESLRVIEELTVASASIPISNDIDTRTETIKQTNIIEHEFEMKESDEAEPEPAIDFAHNDQQEDIVVSSGDIAMGSLDPDQLHLSSASYAEHRRSSMALDPTLEKGIDVISPIQTDYTVCETLLMNNEKDPMESLEINPEDISPEDINAAIKDIEDAEAAIKDIEAAVTANNHVANEPLDDPNKMNPERRAFVAMLMRKEFVAEATRRKEIEMELESLALVNAGDSEIKVDQVVPESEAVHLTGEDAIDIVNAHTNGFDNGDPPNRTYGIDDKNNAENIPAGDAEPKVSDIPTVIDSNIKYSRNEKNLTINIYASADETNPSIEDAVKLPEDDVSIEEQEALQNPEISKNEVELKPGKDKQVKLKKNKKSELDLKMTAANDETESLTSRTDVSDGSIDLNASQELNKSTITPIKYSDDPMMRKLQEMEELKKKRVERKRKQRQEEKEKQEQEEKANEEKKERMESLKKKFEEVKAEKVALMKSREHVVKEVRQLTADVEQKETQVANSWRKKCMTEKKRTDTLEEATAKQKKEIELLHQKLSNTEEDMLSMALTSKQPVGKGNPSERNNHLNSIRQLNIDCENLKTNIENMNRNLAEETKKRNLAQQELKEAREKKYTSIGNTNKFRNTKPLPNIT